MNPQLPAAYGGVGASYLDGCLIGEELAWGCAAIATTLGANELAAAPVLLGGSEEIKKQYLGMLAEEPRLASFCLTEPDAGSDVSGMRTTAVSAAATSTSSTARSASSPTAATPTGTRSTPRPTRTPATAGSPPSSCPRTRRSPSTSTRTRWACARPTRRRSPSTRPRFPLGNLLGEENHGFKLAMMTLDRTRPGVALDGDRHRARGVRVRHRTTPRSASSSACRSRCTRRSSS